jgi:hypothetical protein
MKWKWRIVFAVVLAVIVAANHVEHHLRAEWIRRQAQERDVPVVRAVDNALGHGSIRIDEQAHRSGYLYFDTLESWAFSKSNPGGCPQSVRQVDGKKVKITGFMYPLQEAANLKVFCLLRTTQTCCYGPRPQYNQYVFVEMREPAKFERLAPVVVEGKFVIDPRPADGYIYRMEGQSIRLAVPNDQPASAGEFARQNKLPIFDFAPLVAAKVAADKSAAIAKLSADLDGKQMVVSGFIVGRIKDAPPKIMIGKFAWDGKAKGTPPGLYNTVLVTPAVPSDVPPVWWQEAVFKGTIHVTKDRAERAKNGVVGLADAVLAVAPAADQDLLVDAGPLLPLSYEFVVAFVCAGLFLEGLFKKKTRPTS